MSTDAPAPPAKKGFTFPSTLTVLGLVTLVVWVAAFLIPSGTYETAEDGGPVPGSYQQIDAPQDFGERVRDLLLAPINGLYGVQDAETGFVGPFNDGALYGAVGVFLFVLAIGAFMTMVLATGALDIAIGRVAHRLRARGWLVIVAVMGLFSLLGTTMGWSDETLGFYALLVPLMLALGYDRLTATGMIILGASVGSMASTVNPFSIGVASDQAGISLGDGIGLRMLLWVVLTSVTIAYVIRYAERVRSDPSRSLVGFDPVDEEEVEAEQSVASLVLTGRQKVVLAITAFTFLLLVFSVIPWDSIIGGYEPVDPITHETIATDLWFQLDWWFPELTALFIVATIVVGVVGGFGEQRTAGLLAKGMGDFLGPALAVVLARGVTVILTNTQTIDTVLNAMEGLVDGTSAGVFAFLVFFVNILLAFLIPSSSGSATLTMPLLAPLGDFADVSRSLVVTAWSVGSGWTRLITPTSAVIMGGLALGKVRYDKWIRFVAPLMAILFVISVAILWAAAALE